MTGFLGEFEATMDAKGRFLLPAGFKKQLPESETSRFVINRGFEKCLALYPMRTWEPLFAKITGLNEFDPKQREFRRAFLNGATYVEPNIVATEFESICRIGKRYCVDGNRR
jgi:MraZ protein